ncbi:MAG TPA: hypothetical protein VE954_24395 [Oligoflexus sp.]|uniref:hypothetical protein n=1 Tax=Oligoflexus sp. TaxID=1971216 RepID=UPI002D2F4245|nr:hypothetical protein [Oligoflexus sp.]HYX36256.1 hypothetical protein [Oligoflexus sp.]
MMVSLTRNLALGIMSVVLAAACTSQNDTSAERSAEVSANQDTPKENMKEGWQDVKEGTREVASGVGQATENAADKAVAGVKEAGREVKASTCPVIGNRTSRIFYTQTDKDYSNMLKGDKFLSADQRECFMSERAALDDGYKKAR